VGRRAAGLLSRSKNNLTGLSMSERNPEHQGTFLRLHVWLVAFFMPLLVRLIPLGALLRLLTPPKRLCPYRGLQASEIVRAVSRRLAEPVNMRRRACLRRGLVLFHFLRLAALPATIHFAVYPPGDPAGRMHGHCWVTLDGKDMSEPPEQPYARVMVHGEQP